MSDPTSGDALQRDNQADMAELLGRMERWAMGHGLAVELEPGIDLAQIRAAESVLGFAMPADLRDMLLAANGESWNSEGLIGGWSLLPLQMMVEECQTMGGLLRSGELGENEARATPAVRGLWWNPRWIPIVSSGTGHLICLDMDPGPAGALGQVVLFFHDARRRPLVAHGLRQWLARLADDLEAGLYRTVDGGHGFRRVDGHALMWSSVEAADVYGDPPTAGLAFSPARAGELDWFITDTSTQVLLPESSVAEWQGVFVPASPGEEADLRVGGQAWRVAELDELCHYWRACEASRAGLIAPLGFGAASALVLSAEIWINAWVPALDGRGGVLVRDENWRPNRGFARDELSVGDAEVWRLALEPGEEGWELMFTFRLSEDRLWLMDAGDPGFDLSWAECDPMPIEIAPGPYLVQTKPVEAADGRALTLHRLLPLEGARR